jgi:hypothetical protein
VTRAALRCALLVLAGLILFRWELGPTVYALPHSVRLFRGHGLHLGDPLAAVPALLALPRRRVRLDRRAGIRTPLSPNPGRRADDRP